MGGLVGRGEFLPQVGVKWEGAGQSVLNLDEH